MMISINIGHISLETWLLILFFSIVQEKGQGILGTKFHKMVDYKISQFSPTFNTF